MSDAVKKIAGDRLTMLNSGLACTANLAEILAVDFSLLLKNVAPDPSPDLVLSLARAAGQGIVRRMKTTAAILLDQYGPDYAEVLSKHASDTVRGWASFMIGLQANLSLAERLAAMRPLADDRHFGVREWAWLALRPHLSAELDPALQLLAPWTREDSQYLRRFASESTRPRGVWSAHIARLKEEPQLALPILEPLRSDPSGYVRDSVANWLNDASKSRPEWTRDLCARWLLESPTPETQKICKRALRSIRL